MALAITYQEVREWPGKKTSSRKKAPFKAHATRAWVLLERELKYLNARQITVSGYFRQRDFRRDGGLYADARPIEPGIVLEFVSGKNRLRFAGDRFAFWLDNLDAIARALEALRMVDRYGVTSGEQYEGFRALPSSSSAGASTKDEALKIIAEASGFSETAIRVDGETLLRAVRAARNNAHPDRGGSDASFVRVTQAATLLGIS